MVPVHPLQNSLMSAFVSWAVTLGVNVSPPHVVIVIPTPLPPIDSLIWSRFATRASGRPAS